MLDMPCNSPQAFLQRFGNGSGKFVPSSNYKAIKRLYNKMVGRGFVELVRNFDGWQVNIYNAKGKFIGDAIEHSGSYGHQEDLIEVYGFKLKEPVGYLTVEEAYKYFEPYLNRKE